MIFNPAGLPPRTKYSAQTMNAAHRGTLHSLSHSPNGRLITTVIATASHIGTVFLVSVSTPTSTPLLRPASPGFQLRAAQAGRGQTGLSAAQASSEPRAPSRAVRPVFINNR